MAEYGLLGEKLSHSFSKIIHEKLRKYSYELMPMGIDELHQFLKSKDFLGVNVTIPYKKEVMPFCDEIENNAKKIGSVNAIVNKNDKLVGYNTDFLGFSYLLQKNDIVIENKTVLILGCGATYQTIRAVLEHQNAKKIVVASRRKNDNIPNIVTYEEALNQTDAQLIINATPVGMFPNCNDSALDLSNFTDLEAVVDAIYNPLNTGILQQAKVKGIKAVNGLLMLVAQAIYASELFTGEKVSENVLLNIYNEINNELTNIVLVGMPSAGKTTIGINLAKKLRRQFVDIDKVIEEQENMIVSEIFKQKGEAYFRQIENEVIDRFSKKTGTVISTGGGSLLNQANIFNLKLNSKIFFINRDIEKLLVDSNRPLSKSKQDIQKLYDERFPLYNNNCDFVIDNNDNLNLAIEKIIKIFLKGSV